ncbi:hypothetical protein JNB63_11770 [Microbacterium trichothecenolyticum]|uniref:hypothetical protein n=1 Tax=Microbacterium trichothecenolyticum TaxID=69370 RepID=UPI001C6E0985|nr:hypothetical protein [Microbacterium trichothecenolyticum]MBW9120775.1 hypothetical protein [Microbacterium trichothecenolyticum]
MDLLYIAAEEAAATQTELADWLPLAVAIVGAFSAVGVAIWNGRGETAALRKLKAMNEALAGLPDDGAVALGFSAARDVLAERIATRITGPSLWKRFWRWLVGVVAGVAVVGAIWGASLLAPELSRFTENLISVIAAVAGSAIALAVATSSWIGLRKTARQAEEARRDAVATAFEIRWRSTNPESGDATAPGEG